MADNAALARLEEAVTELDTIAQDFLTKKTTALASFKDTLVHSMAVIKMELAFSKEVMEYVVIPMKNKSLGFKTDEDSRIQKGHGPYPMETVRNCVIEATLRGLRCTNNEFNIIKGNFYATVNGCARLVREFPGLSDLRIMPQMPQIVPGGAIVGVVATWTLNGTPMRMDRTGEYAIAVKLVGDQGADAAIGKAKRKMYAAIYERLVGSNQSMPEGDADEVIDFDNIKRAEGSVVSSIPQTQVAAEVVDSGVPTQATAAAKPTPAAAKPATAAKPAQTQPAVKTAPAAKAIPTPAAAKPAPAKKAAPTPAPAPAQEPEPEPPVDLDPTDADLNMDPEPQVVDEPGAVEPDEAAPQAEPVAEQSAAPAPKPSAAANIGSRMESMRETAKRKRKEQPAAEPAATEAPTAAASTPAPTPAPAAATTAPTPAPAAATTAQSPAPAAATAQPKPAAQAAAQSKPKPAGVSEETIKARSDAFKAAVAFYGDEAQAKELFNTVTRKYIPFPKPLSAFTTDDWLVVAKGLTEARAEALKKAPPAPPAQPEPAAATQAAPEPAAEPEQAPEQQAAPEQPQAEQTDDPPFDVEQPAAQVDEGALTEVLVSVAGANGVMKKERRHKDTQKLLDTFFWVNDKDSSQQFITRSTEIATIVQRAFKTAKKVRLRFNEQEVDKDYGRYIIVAAEPTDEDATA